MRVWKPQLVRVQAHPNYRPSVRAAYRKGAPAPETKEEIETRRALLRGNRAHQDREVSPATEARRGTGPRPTVQRDQEVSPTGKSRAARPGGFSYDRGTARDRPSPYGAARPGGLSYGEIARSETRRALLREHRAQRDREVSPATEARRGTGPRPTVH